MKIDISKEIANKNRRAITGEFNEAYLENNMFTPIVDCDVTIVEPDGKEYFYHYSQKSQFSKEDEAEEIEPVELIDPQESDFDDIFRVVKVIHLHKVFPEVPIEDINFVVYGDEKGPGPVTDEDRKFEQMLENYFFEEKIKKGKIVKC